MPLDLLKWEEINQSRKNENYNLNIKIKRILEIIFASTFLIISTPILIICAILIYLEDKGSILYSQERTGIFGRKFVIYKLRSMKLNAEKKVYNGQEKMTRE